MCIRDSGWVDFQDYFVAQQHSVPVENLRFQGIEEALPGPSVIASLEEADAIVIAPSNPFVSVKPVLEITGVGEIIKQRREKVVAISPIVGGAALKGPASRMLEELGFESSVVGIASLYREFASALVIDHADAKLAAQVEATGLRSVVTDTIMSDIDRAAALAKAVLGNT